MLNGFVHGYFLVMLFLFCGCGALSYHEKSIDACIARIAEARNEHEIKYLGKSKEVLVKDFNNPCIRHDILLKGVHYDEEWSYSLFGGWLGSDCAQTIWFYINKGVIEAVSVF